MSEPRPTLTADYQRDWPAYFDSVRNQPPRDTLLRAADGFVGRPLPDAAAFPVDSMFRIGPSPRLHTALDLACGEGRDTRELLRRGDWRVLAVDNSPEGLRRLAASCPDEPRLAVLLCPMERVPETLSHSAATFDLINASFALPFCPETSFPTLWRWICDSLRAGGRFAGQLFGDRDEWSSVNPRRHHTRDEVLRLLQGFEIEHFNEVEKEGADAMGGTKHHHVFHIVAKRH